MGYRWDLGGKGVWGGMRIWGDMGTLGYEDVWGCSLQERSTGQKVMCGAGMRGRHGCTGAVCGYGAEMGYGVMWSYMGLWDHSLQERSAEQEMVM